MNNSDELASQLHRELAAEQRLASFDAVVARRILRDYHVPAHIICRLERTYQEAFGLQKIIELLQLPCIMESIVPSVVCDGYHVDELLLAPWDVSAVKLYMKFIIDHCGSESDSQSVYGIIVPMGRRSPLMLTTKRPPVTCIKAFKSDRAPEAWNRFLEQFNCYICPLARTMPIWFPFKDESEVLALLG